MVGCNEWRAGMHLRYFLLQAAGLMSVLCSSHGEVHPSELEVLEKNTCYDT